MTPYQLHVSHWKNCTRCPLHEHRCQVVFARGKLPCDVLFCGEAPGQSEDALGQPFMGPAGHLLDQIVGQALNGWMAPGRPPFMPSTEAALDAEQQQWDREEAAVRVRTAFYNLVGCFPLEAKRSGDHEPPREAIEACAPRLREFVALAKPKLIVCVGALAERWVPKIIGISTDNPVACVSIVHPAFILSRLHPTAQPLAVQKAVVTLSDAIEELA